MHLTPLPRCRSQPDVEGVTRTAPSNGYPSSARVHADGAVHEVDSTEGRRWVFCRPDIVAYAVALLWTDRQRVAFYWREAATWHRITIERDAADVGAAALVTAWTEPLPLGLTSRELDVLTLLGGGLDNKQIAARLRTSARTVGTHVEHVLGKLSQRSRAGASAVAVDRGLLRLPIPGGADGLEGLTVGLIDRSAGGRGRPSPTPLVALASSRPAARRPLLIGSALPLTGPARSDGFEMRNGAALAIAEINARGGVAGRRLEHVVVPVDVFDDGSIRSAFDALAAADVDAITSLYVFAEDVALERAAAYGGPYLHAMTSEHLARSVAADPGRFGNVFQVCPSEIHYGGGFIRFLDDLSASGRWAPHDRSVLFIETVLQSSQMATGQTLEAAEASGWRVAGVHYVAAEGADWGSVVSLIHRTDPGAILVTDFLPAELAGFQRRFAAAPTNALVFAVYSPSVPEFLELAGGAAEGLVWSTVTGTYGDVMGERFVRRFAEFTGKPPGRSHAGIAYDEIHLLARAWSDVDNPRDFRAVAGRLRRVPYRGVNGSYFLDNARQSALAFPDMTPDPSLSQAHLVLQIQDGAHRVLSPAPYVEAVFRRPSWWPAERTSA
jgi:branched-chain amino acid transport system substrate-binding protein